MHTHRQLYMDHKEMFIFSNLHAHNRHMSLLEAAIIYHRPCMHRPHRSGGKAAHFLCHRLFAHRQTD